MILPPPPPHSKSFLSKNFFENRNFLIHRRVPIRKNLVKWDKICSTEKRDIRLLCLKFSTPEINEKKRVHPRKIRYCETKNIRKKIVTLLISKKFLIPEQFWNRKGFPYECFRYCETKKNKRKSWYNPRMLKSFRYPEIVKHFKVPPRNFSVSWEQRNWLKIVIFLISKLIWYQDVFETHKGSPTKIFGAVGQQKFVR